MRTGTVNVRAHANHAFPLLYARLARPLIGYTLANSILPMANTVFYAQMYQHDLQTWTNAENVGTA